MKSTSIADHIKPVAFLRQAVQAMTVKTIASLLSQLPIVDENEYAYDSSNPAKNWVEGKLHWIPLGKDRGNAGRIKLASRPEGPIAERTINGMEALIELMRRLELLQDPSAPVPQSPREAVARYFSLPPLDQIPRMQKNPLASQTALRARSPGLIARRPFFSAVAPSRRSSRNPDLRWFGSGP